MLWIGGHRKSLNRVVAMYKVRIKISKEYRSMLDNMLKQLEENNVAYTGNGGFVRSFSIQAEQPRKKGHILFSHNSRWRKSVVSLAPNVKLKKAKCGFEIVETKVVV